MKSRLLFVMALFPFTAHAGVGKISGPLATKGQFVAKHFYSQTFDDKAPRDGNDFFRGGYEYDFGENWVSEIGFNGTDFYREGTRLKATTFEVMRTATRQSNGWWLSSGIIGGYSLNTDHGNDKALARLRLQREDGPLRLRFNTALNRDVGSEAKADILVGTNGSAVYTLTPHFKPALEWHADWGTTAHISARQNQKHWAGPAIYGDLHSFQNGSKLEYQTGYMFGLTKVSEDGVGILVLDYRVQF